jgi:TonB family protein
VKYETNTWLGAALFLSVIGHAATYLALGNISLERVREELATLDFEIQEDPPPLEELPEPEPEDPEPEPELPPPEPEPRAEPRREEPEPEPEPAPAEETPVAFDNVTLTNEGESSFAMQASSGVEREGPIGRPGAAVTGRSREGRAGGTPGGTGQGPAGPPLVAVENLSRRPDPPSAVGSFLQQLYPQDERRQGIEGVARVRLRIEPTGAVRFVRAVSSTSPSFAQACQRALERAGNWRPPLDQAGQPVATVINFRCDFEVEW